MASTEDMRKILFFEVAGSRWQVAGLENSIRNHSTLRAPHFSWKLDMVGVKF